MQSRVFVELNARFSSKRCGSCLECFAVIGFDAACTMEGFRFLFFPAMIRHLMTSEVERPLFNYAKAGKGANAALYGKIGLCFDI